MKLFSKSLAVVALGALMVASANAVTITLESAGTWTIIGSGPDWTQAESVIQSVSSTAPLPELDNLAVTVSGSTSSNPTAVATYSNVANTESLTLDWTITDQQYSGDTGEIFSMDGTWAYNSGTGHYANMQGSGTFAVTQTGVHDPSGFSGTVLAGDLSAVPEPAPFAALGLGALVLVRRRRSA